MYAWEKRHAFSRYLSCGSSRIPAICVFSRYSFCLIVVFYEIHHWCNHRTMYNLHRHQRNRLVLSGIFFRHLWLWIYPVCGWKKSYGFPDWWWSALFYAADICCELSWYCMGRRFIYSVCAWGKPGTVSGKLFFNNLLCMCMGETLHVSVDISFYERRMLSSDWLRVCMEEIK